MKMEKEKEKEIEIKKLKSKIEEIKGILIEGNLDPETYETMMEIMKKDVKKLEEMEKEMSNLMTEQSCLKLIKIIKHLNKS